MNHIQRNHVFLEDLIKLANKNKSINQSSGKVSNECIKVGKINFKLL